MKSKKKPKGKKLYESPYPFVVNVTLDDSLDEFLDRLGVQVRESGGHKLVKTRIFRGLARVLKELIDSEKIDLSGVKTEDQFVERLRKAFGSKR